MSLIGEDRRGRGPDGIIVELAEQIGRGLRAAANRLASVSGRPGQVP